MQERRGIFDLHTWLLNLHHSYLRKDDHGQRRNR